MALKLPEKKPFQPSVIVTSSPDNPKPPSAPKYKTSAKPQKMETSGNAAQIIAAIQKAKGTTHVIVHGNEVAIVERIPTGVFEWDFYLGGGFPCGRYSIVYGPESSNKTNMCLLAVAEAQRRPGPCNKAVWVNVEQSFDPIWAGQLGVDVDELILVNPAYGEEAVDIIDALVRAEDVAILVVDSVAAMVASKEIAQSAENFDVGTSALMIKRLVNKLMVAFGEERRKEHYPCVILINQTRFKIGVMFGDPETMPGGEAQKFLSSLRVRTYAKNEVLKHINPNLPAIKKTSVIVKKSKIPILSVSFEFELVVLEHEGMKVGSSRSFNMVKGHLQTLGFMDKGKNGYEIAGEFNHMHLAPDAIKKNCTKEWLEDNAVFPTLSVIEDKYYADHDFRLRLQKMIIDAHSAETFLVDEPTPNLKIEPGTIVEAPDGEPVSD